MKRNFKIFSVTLKQFKSCSESPYGTHKWLSSMNGNGLVCDWCNQYGLKFGKYRYLRKYFR